MLRRDFLPLLGASLKDLFHFGLIWLQFSKIHICQIVIFNALNTAGSTGDYLQHHPRDLLTLNTTEVFKLRKSL